MRVVQSYSADACCVPAVWRHPLDLAIAALSPAQSRLPLNANATGHEWSAEETLQCSDGDELRQTEIPPILEIEASAVKAADMMTQLQYKELLSRASSRRLSCAAT